MVFRVCILLALTVCFSCNQIKNQEGELLEAFSTINKRLDSVNTHNTYLPDAIILENEKYATYVTRFEQVHHSSEILNNQVARLKRYIILNGIDTPEQMKSAALIDSLFFIGKGYTDEGRLFVANIDTLRTTFSMAFTHDFPELSKNVKEDFNTNSIASTPWLTYHFKGFPLIASLTKLTQLESDIKDVKQELIVAMIAKEADAVKE